jgi:hypothetical protein
MTGLSAAAGRRRFFCARGVREMKSTDVRSEKQNKGSKKTNDRQQKSFQYSEIVLYYFIEEKAPFFRQTPDGRQEKESNGQNPQERTHERYDEAAEQHTEPDLYAEQFL